jgi:hypothetical protein
VRGSFRKYALNHGLHIGNIAVPEPQHPVAAGTQIIVARAVLLISMLPAVDLDDQPLLKTQKIDNVSPHRHLSPELHPANGAVPRMVPETRLGAGWLLAHVPGKLLKPPLGITPLHHPFGDHPQASPHPALSPGGGEEESRTR